MPLSKEMLKILCCPVTKVPVKMLSEDKLKLVNELISKKAVRDIEGNPVEEQLSEAVITEDKQTIYRIDDDIPVMLVSSGIPGDQIENL